VLSIVERFRHKASERESAFPDSHPQTSTPLSGHMDSPRPIPVKRILWNA
jgi:hypothetical protein